MVKATSTERPLNWPIDYVISRQKLPVSKMLLAESVTYQISKLRSHQYQSVMYAWTIGLTNWFENGLLNGFDHQPIC